MDLTKAVLVITVSFMAGCIVGMVLLFVFEERYDKQAGDIYLEEDDEVSQCNEGD